MRDPNIIEIGERERGRPGLDFVSLWIDCYNFWFYAEKLYVGEVEIWSRFCLCLGITLCNSLEYMEGWKTRKGTCRDVIKLVQGIVEGLHWKDRAWNWRERVSWRNAEVELTGLWPLEHNWDGGRSRSLNFLDWTDR